MDTGEFNTTSDKETVRIELNKEYIDAPYELAFLTKGGQVVTYPHPPRFNIIPPESVWLDSEKVWKWIHDNKIPTCVRKP
jgi:hypothetical protein